MLKNIFSTVSVKYENKMGIFKKKSERWMDGWMDERQTGRQAGRQTDRHPPSRPVLQIYSWATGIFDQVAQLSP